MTTLIDIPLYNRNWRSNATKFLKNVPIKVVSKKKLEKLLADIYTERT